MRAAAPRATDPGADRGLHLIEAINRLGITTRLLDLGFAAVAHLHPRAADAIALGIADAIYALWSGLRFRAEANLAWVVGPERAPVAARSSVRNYVRYVVDFLRFHRWSNEELHHRSTVIGVEHLHNAMALGRGVIAIGFHLGNIDLGATLLGQQGYAVHVVVEPFQPPALDELIQGQRRRRKLNLIPLERAARESLRVLRQRAILALLVDRPVPGDGVPVRFFGGTVFLPAGAARLALRTGAPIVPCCAFRTRPGAYTAELAEPILPEHYAGAADPVQAVTQAMVETLERWVRRMPSQWYPFRAMFQESDAAHTP